MKFFLLLAFSTSLFAKLSLDEKIGKLFMAPAHPKYREELKELMKEIPIGGIIVKATSQEEHITVLQELPENLLVAADAEWGLGMRYTDAPSYPKQLTLGAIQKESLLLDLGRQIGKDCRQMGIDLCFGPVVDVNTNPKNPIIHMRSFGEDPEEVARKGSLVMKGMREMGLSACCKHFPGHGNTKTDSHIDLPLLKQNFSALKETELLPFQTMIEKGIPAVMTGHLLVPALDEENPATLSHKTLSGLLRKECGFQGLLISDALNMRALKKTPEEIALLAFAAGNDILLYGDHIGPNIACILKEDMPRAFRALKKAFEEGRFSEEMLDERIARIDAMKKPRGELVKVDPLKGDIIELQVHLFEEAITLLKNEKEYLPILPGKDVYRMTISDGKITTLGDKESKRLVISLKGEKIPPSTVEYIHSLDREKEVVLVLYTSPYEARHFDAIQGSLLLAYEDVSIAEDTVYLILMGLMEPKGHLPVTVSEKFPRNYSFVLREVQELAP